MDAEKVLFALLRAAVCGAAVEDEIKATCTPEMLEQVYALADRHDLAHLVGQAASKLDLPESEALAKCKQAAMQAFMRYMQLNHAYAQACKTLDEAKIPFIPLKGSVLRSYYPELWMRTSCDIDILVREEMLDTAIRLFTDKLSYMVKCKSEYDVSMYSPEGAHLELHYDTIQERYAVHNCRDVLGQIWERAVPIGENSYHYILPDPVFYFYHMAHMVKHFEVGGCGIRAFLDIWIMCHKMEHDADAREALLREGGLLKFAQAAEKVAQIWFSGEEPDENSQQVSNYIIKATLYGDNENRAALGRAKMGGKFRYVLLRRVFMPYDYLKAEYPILKKHKWLLPVYQVVRWLRMLFSGGLGRTMRELRANAQLKETKDYSAEDILKYLGL